jgi:predicted DNA-binding transcriptional regulator AlpA
MFCYIRNRGDCSLDDNLISKKEVLELTGISYGQLYRWKRKQIIPEEWFIKKSSFTGQETYFPREKMLARIKKVKKMKDTHSLDELSDFFSPNPAKIELSLDGLRLQKILRTETLSLCSPLIKNAAALEFQDILNMFILEKVQNSLNENDLKTLFLFLQKDFDAFSSPSFELRGLKKQKNVIWLLIPLQSDILTDRSAETIVNLDLLQMVEELKIILTNELN